jgi:hypothetical protein
LVGKIFWEKMAIIVRLKTYNWALTMDLGFRNYNSNKISSIQRRYLVTFSKER